MRGRQRTQALSSKPTDLQGQDKPSQQQLRSVRQANHADSLVSNVSSCKEHLTITPGSITGMADKAAEASLAAVTPNSLPIRDQEGLSSEVKSLSQSTPRFLFRVWSKGFGVRPAPNTVDAIIPAAFSEREGPASIYDMSKDQVARILEHHLQKAHVPETGTVFSSWSQSLPFVLDYARFRATDGETDIYISVIDTTLLAEENVVLHAPALKLFTDKPLLLDQYEYLAFGTITGRAHSAVSYRTLLQHGIKDLSQFDVTKAWFTYEGLGRVNPAKFDLAIAHKAANEFADDFRLVLAANIMAGTRRTGDELDEITMALSKYPVLKEWGGYPGDEGELGGVVEAQRAVALLQALVEQAAAHGGPQSIIRTLRFKAKLVMMQGEETRQAAKSTARLPKILRDLHAGEGGWGRSRK